MPAAAIRFFYEGFIEQTQENVAVTAGETTQVDAVLTLVGYGESVDVIAGAGGDIVAALEERKTATTISDNLSKVEIANDTSSNAAGVLQRVTGVTVQDDFVYVRGLGERYSNTVINDALVPTPQPDRRVVPMDLIPTNLLQDVKILKTFTPDQPGEFSGGLVRLDTVELPAAASLTMGYSMGWNSQTQGHKYLGYPGDNLDFFGFGLNRRELPSIIPTDVRVVRGNAFIPGGVFVAWTVVDRRVTDPIALSHVMAHEIGHTFGLAECDACEPGSSVMRRFNDDYDDVVSGRNAPSDGDNAAVRANGGY